ncbi:MAG: peptidoglycan DD-metalloendopeptidase family protein [Bacteroidetes bacterium]|nr:peptidoglycan DD-metalloendopeptidase family protein [Bacteroidota bacterium]
MSDLKTEQEKLQQRVQQTENLLKETRNVKRKSFNELSLLRKQVQLRERLLETINDEIHQINREVDRIEGILVSMEKDIVTFRKSYAQAARMAYLSQSDIHVLLWLMSSSGFRQAYDRMVYFQEFAKYRRNQLAIVRRTQKYLEQKKAEKQEKLRLQQLLLDNRKTEAQRLADAKQKKDELYNQLRGKEAQYEQNITQYKKELAKIREEIKKMVAASSQNMTAANKDVIHKLTANFSSNKGKLPWPLPMNKGVVTGYFGRSRTPTGGEVINDGIYISTARGQEVRAIFDGKVTMIGKIPNYGRVVILQHGSYRSVYANLQTVSVSQGDQVSALTPLGTVQTHEETGETQLYFQLYRDFNPVNPIGWLAK